MPMPVIRGLIERRILVNYRVDPPVLAALLPRPLRPTLVGGAGLAGICLIRLGQIRPRFWPRRWGLASENAAHRIAVEWDEPGGTAQGVFVLRRDTASRLNVLAGGRLFPGVHHHARFAVDERGGRYRVEMHSDDGRTHLLVDARAAAAWPLGSAFASLDEASDFFRRGSLGYSLGPRPGCFQAVELCCRNWSMAPLAVERVESSLFAADGLLPHGSVEFDSACLVEGVEHEWRSRPPLYVDGAP